MAGSFFIYESNVVEGDGKRRIWVVQSWNLLSLNTNTWY